MSGTGLKVLRPGDQVFIRPWRDDVLTIREGESARGDPYFFFPPSSAMYMISCLNMKRLGAPSRVRRTMCLS